MSLAQEPHPDRRAETLLQVLEGSQAAAAGGFRAPGAGSADCRIDLKLLIRRAERAMARSAAAREHLAPLARDRHPDLWAGTVPDAVARGFAARLEEACSLAPVDAAAAPEAEPDGAEVVTGRDLRRKKDLLVASGGARARFSRRGGVLLVDRANDVHSENALWFEARRDEGTLDGFVGAADERARLFSAQFLKPTRYVTSAAADALVLTGSLGRGPVRWPCRVVLRGAAALEALCIDIELPVVAAGWRLRTRVRGVPATQLHHECTAVREQVDDERGGFVADTLVRACGHLTVGAEQVRTPAAAAPAPLHHRFWFGAPPACL